MGCGLAVATGLDFVYFVVINPCVLLSANIVDFRLFFVAYFSFYSPPPSA